MNFHAEFYLLDFNFFKKTWVYNIYYNTTALIFQGKNNFFATITKKIKKILHIA